MKSMNMISGTGRIPAMAEPIAAPMIPSSAIGVLRTRSSPCVVERPSVRWNTPPPAESATSSPMMKTRGSLVMAWSRAWVMAARKVSCRRGGGVLAGLAAVRRRRGVHVLGDQGRIGRRVGVGHVVGVGDLGRDAGLDVGQRGLVGLALLDEPRPEAGQRVVGLLGRQLVGVHVLVLVAQHVAEGPEGHALEQHRAVAPAGVVDRLAGGLVGGGRVHPVDLDALHRVRRGAVDHGGRLLGVGELGVLAVLVVLADEDDGQRPHRGHVERLVEGADVRRAVTEVADGDPAVALELRGQTEPDRDRQAATDDAGAEHQPVVGVGDVHRAAPALRGARRLAQHLGPELAQRHALGDLVADAAVGRRHVVGRARWPCRRRPRSARDP